MQEDCGPLAMVTPGYEQIQVADHQQQQQSESAVAMTTGQQPTQEYGTDQAQFEADKRAVYKHPLFPLLALLFEKCELATQSAEAPNSDSFNMDIQAFVQHQERDRKPFLMDDPEVDGLMIKAIQVLRIHLLELEKVQELCKDFCNRYITCLKGKMQSENLLRSDYSYEQPSHSANSSPNSHSSYSSNNHSQNSHNVVAASTPSLVAIQQPNTQIAYQMVQTVQGLLAQPIQIHNSMSVSHANAVAMQQQQGIIHGSTPLSQIGTNTCPPPQDSSLLQGQDDAPPTPSSIEDDDEILGKKKPKRGVLPKHATSIMRSWLFQHIVHPYPTEDEKRQIASQTNLTLLQVNNWFINARRRILQPMLDASNPDATHKAKKAKTQPSKPAVQRFWPDNLVNLQCQGQNGEDDQDGTTPNSDSNMISSTVLSSDESDDSSRDAVDNSVLDHSDSSSQQ